MTGRRIYASRTGVLVRCTIKERKAKYEHTSPDIEDGNAESGLAEGVGDCATKASREGEGVDPRSRRVGGRAPADAVDGRGKGVQVRRAQREGEPARPVRRPSPIDCLPRVLRAGCERLARACL